MGYRWVIISILLFSLLICGSAAATGDSQLNNQINNSLGNSTNSTVNSSEFNDSTSSTDIISGNVTRCTNGQPFPGVTITVSSLSGTEIAHTTSDQNGFYQINFGNGSNDQRDFAVTASHPGHMTVTRQVAVYPDSNGSVYHGFANFQLGPIPNLNIADPSEQFLNESFTFQLNFNNTGNETGFGPMVELILPPQIQYQSGSYLGITLNPWTGVFSPTGVLTNPFTGLPVTGTPGSTLYIFQQPLGSFTPGQPTATVDVTALLLGNSTLGAPLNITATPVFRFGANETGGAPIVGSTVTTQVTPTVIRLTKTSNAPEAETVTGQNYQRTYTLTIDVANGQTVNNVILTDVIPGNLQFVSISGDGTPILLPSTTTPGGTLRVNMGNITGIIGPDRYVYYTVYAPRFDNMSNPVLDPLYGNWNTATNWANVTGNYSNINVSARANYTLTLKSLAIQKSVTDITGGPNSPKPTNILRWDLHFQVSDYFALKNMVLNDVFGDGQSFLDWPIRNPTYQPRLNINIPGSSITNLLVDLNNPNQFTYFHNSTTGLTYLFFNISQILIDNSYTGGTGIIYGGNNTTGYYGATQGTLTFWSQIQPYYEGVEPPNLHPIVSNDPIINNVTINAQLLNNNQISDTSSNGVVIVAPTAQKTLFKINGNDPVGPPYVIQPGDNVTFSLLVNVPTSSLHQFDLVDYLPIPFFRANQFTTGQLQNTTLPIPTPGQWRLSTTDTLSAFTGVIPTLVVDATQNVLRFNYGNISNSTQPSSVVNILFTVTATGDPMADGLYLTNLLNINYENSPGNMFTDNKVVLVQTGQPVLNINKTATPTTGLQAGDVVTYTILISNTGHAPAYNVVVKDNLFTSNPSYINSVVMAARYVAGPVITGLNLMDIFSPAGLNFTALYPIYGVNGTNNTINITYLVTLNSTIYPLQVLNNTVNITKFTSLPPPESPNFVDSPRIDKTNLSDNESVSTRRPDISKAVVGHSEPVTIPPNFTIGELVKFRVTVNMPKGQMNDLTVTDLLPPGLAYYADSAYNYTVNTTGFNGTLGTLTVTPGAGTVTFRFQGTSQANPDGNSLSNIFFIDFWAVILNNSSNQPGTGSILKTNVVNLDWSNPGHITITNFTTFNVVEPRLTAAKTINPSTAMGGQQVTITITLNNTGQSRAFGVNLIDQLDPNVYNWSTITEGTTPSGNGFVYDSSAPTTGIVRYTGGFINSGQTLTFSFRVNVIQNLVSGSTYTNFANATYNSLNSTSTPFTENRNYNTSASATLTSNAPSISKVVNRTSEPDSGIVPTRTNVLIGEVVTYQLDCIIPAGVTRAVSVNDVMPANLAFLDGIQLGVDHRPQISRNTTNVMATGFNFTNSGLSNPEIFTNYTYNAITRTITFNLGNITNSVNTSATIRFLFDVVVLNSAINNATTPLISNTGVLNYTRFNNTTTSASGTTTGQNRLQVIVPVLNVTKQAVTVPLPQGGDQVTYTILLTNTGNAPAYNLVMNDLLPSTLTGASVVSVTPSNPLINPSWTLVGNNFTMTMDQLNTTWNISVVLQCVITPDAPLNSTIRNNVTVNGTSLPGAHGTGNANPGDPGTSTGERTGSGGVNNIYTTAVADVRTRAVGITKTSAGSKNVTRTVGDVIEQTITINIPRGYTSSAIVTDQFPAGLVGVGSPVGFTYFFSNPFIYTQFSPAAPTQVGNTWTYNFGWLNATQPGNLTIIYNVTVMNVLGNVNGTNLTNNATVSYVNGTGSTISIWDTSTITVIEPNLLVNKQVNPNLVDGGDRVTININVTNNGTSPAYRLNITDVLDPNLFNAASATAAPGFPVGFNLIVSGNTIYITANPGNFINNDNIPVSFPFYVNVLSDAPLNSTFQNMVGTLYYSLPLGYPEARNYTNSSNVVNITTMTPNMAKVLESTSEPDSTGRNVFIGEVVTYRLDLTIPEGKTLNVVLQDILPTNLRYNTGSAQILRNNAAITATGFSFTQTNVYENIPVSSPTLTFNLGNITFTGATGLLNGTISIRFNATVLNILTNQAGTQIPNSATFNFTNSTGSARSLTSNCPDTLNVLVPHISTDKTFVSQNQDQITFNVIVRNDNNANGGPAYNLQVLDLLVKYKNLQIMSISPSTGTIVYTESSTPNLLNITINQLNQTQFLNITYRATFNESVVFGQQVNNTVTYTGTTLPGDRGTNNATPGAPGTDDGKRTGQDGPVGLNNIYATSTVTVTSRRPSISKTADGQKTVNQTIGETVNESIVMSLPIGTTNELYITDLMPAGLQVLGGVGGFTIINSAGVVTGAPIISYNSGSNTYIINLGTVTASQAGNITINYLALVLDVPGNVNGVKLTNNATLFYINSTNQYVNGGYSNATVNVVEPNLSITKTVSKNNLVIGEEFTYRIFITHTSTSTADAYNVTISDTIPNGLTYVPDSAVLPSGWTLNVVGNTLTFFTNFLNLSTYNATLLFNCTVDNNISLAGKNITNTANLTYTSTASGGRTYGPVDSSAEIHIIGADLQVFKSTDPYFTAFNAGENIFYRITVTNNGPDVAQNVVLKDIFSDYAPSSSWFNWLVNPQYRVDSGSWNPIPSSPWNIPLGNINPGNSVYVFINATISPAAPIGVLNNTANVTSTTTDPNPDNNNSTETTNVNNRANLVLNKQNDPNGTVIAGHNILYTINLTNNGPSVARDVILRDDALSSYYLSRFYRYSVNGGAWSDWTGFSGALVLNVTNSTNFPAGYMGVWDNFTVQINGTVDPATPNGTVLTNYANATSSTSPFEVISNEVSNIVDTRADLTLSKVNDPAGTVMAGNNLLYTLVLINPGPSVARDVVLRDDTLSVWLINRQYRYRINGRAWSGPIGFTGSLVVDVTSLFPAGYMGVGENFTVEINSTVNASTPNSTVLTNYANVTSSTSPFEVISNEVTNTVNTLANLTITKVADIERIIRGYPIRYTIVVTNNGPSEALNVNFYDEYAPQLLENTFYSTSNGIPWTAYTNPLSIIPLIDRLAPGANVTIWMNGTVALNATEGLNNTATTNSETDPAGNKTTTVKTPIQTSDVSIQKTVSNPRPYIHETIFFTLIVQNRGPDTAIDVYVIDKLPDGVRFVSYTANYGTYDPVTGYWIIGNLPRDTIAEMVVTCVVEKLGPMENHAHVYTASWDPILDDHSASASIYVRAAPGGNQTIPMRNTGTPLELLALAILLSLSGMVVSRKK